MPYITPVEIQAKIDNAVNSCGVAFQGLKNEVLSVELHHILDSLNKTISTYGCIWLTGSGMGFCLAAEVCQRLSTASGNQERPTRASVLGMNPTLTSSFKVARKKSDASLSGELELHARTNDVLWCFAPDEPGDAIIDVARTAKQKTKIPVIVFSGFPGSSLCHFSDMKIRVQHIEEDPSSLYCVQWMHSFLASVVCDLTKKNMKRVMQNARRTQPE